MEKKENITEQLFAMQDIEYREFQAKLIPGMEMERIIGIRTPVLRRLAKKLMDTSAEETFLKILPHRYYDENNLHGMLIAQMKDYKRCMEELNRFLPYVDNWATCDLISPKIFRKHLEELVAHIWRWLDSGETYIIRFGIRMLMNFYLDETFSEEYLERVAAVRSEEYYVNMMIAWYFATALAKQYEKTLPFLTEQRLDIWTHNKTIQKAIESYRITPEQKDYLRTLKRFSSAFLN